MRDMNYLLSIKDPAFRLRLPVRSDLGEFDAAFAAFRSFALKIDPAFVETVEHAYAGFRM
jgi:hypothetical protein